MKYSLALFILAFAACTSKLQVAIPAIDKPIAFPGAEGFGKYTSGGRGGKVLIVTNLHDDGAGSLRQALRGNDEKIIVFRVSGTIHLLSPLAIPSNTTIAGQSAPGDGICLADHSVQLAGNNIIIRFMRFRLGDRYQDGGMVHGSGDDDAFGGFGRKNIIIDHCSMSWSTDEVCTVYNGDSTTLQWNIISEPLNYSYHFERGDKDFEQHGFGGIWGGAHTSAHHNLLAHCVSRTPRFNGVRHSPTELVDFRNNVIYNWAGNNVYGGEGGTYNIVGNYYKYGPSTRRSVRHRVANPFKSATIPFGKYFIAGNYVDGSPAVSDSNWLGVVMQDGTDEDKREAKVQQAFNTINIPNETATKAYEQVLAFAGCSHRRDTLDLRIVNDVKNRTGRIIDVQGGFAHGTLYEVSRSAWPALASLPAPADSDNDGMPDNWEVANGLSPSNSADAVQYKLSTTYTNIEVYLNELVKNTLQ